MTKADIVAAVRERTGFSGPKSVEAVEMVFELIRERLEQGGSIKLSGFGGFGVRQKTSRPGRNPKTGEDVEITARKVVTFKASHILMGKVQETS